MNLLARSGCGSIVPECGDHANGGRRVGSSERGGISMYIMIPRRQIRQTVEETVRLRITFLLIGDSKLKR
jgi:hypothetical protein